MDQHLLYGAIVGGIVGCALSFIIYMLLRPFLQPLQVTFELADDDDNESEYANELDGFFTYDDSDEDAILR